MRYKPSARPGEREERKTLSELPQAEDMSRTQGGYSDEVSTATYSTSIPVDGVRTVNALIIDRSHLTTLNLICWFVVFALVLIPEALMVAHRFRTGDYRIPQVDFVFFYGMGKIFNQYANEDLYNYELEKKVLTDLRPQTEFVYPPNPYPPFVGMLFRPFARLEYQQSMLLWSLTSVALYVGGLFILSRHFFPRDFLRRSLIFCFALSLYPFLLVLNLGQLSSIGFFAMTLALCEEDRGRPFWSGISISACLYKPTLALLLIPMLLVTKRYRTLVGVAAGGAILAVLVAVLQGPGAWHGYGGVLFSAASAAIRFGAWLPSTGGHFGLNVLRFYVDMAAFSALLPGGHSLIGRAIFISIAALVGFSLTRAWRKTEKGGRDARSLIWATTITWTLILNLYVPMTDSILIVPSMVATAAILGRSRIKGMTRYLRPFWLLIPAAPILTSLLGDSARIQLLAVVISLFGILQFKIVAKNRTIQTDR
jgi:hypothetical protein